MYQLRNLVKKAAASLAIFGSVAASGAAGLVKSGAEYRFLPSLPGDQMLPQISFNEKGGYLVTQDNSIDGNGLGIRARKYYPDLSASRWTFQVNSDGRGEQQNAKVAVFAAGGAVFAWQGSTPAGNRVFVRFLNAAETFNAAEIQASATAVGNQTDPAVIVLADQSAVVSWTEWNRDGHMDGIFAQRFSANGARLGNTFQVNQSAQQAQRSSALAALPNGNFAIAWVQEFSGVEAIHIYGRIYQPDGTPVTGALRLSETDHICANPSITAAGTGFRVAWSSRKLPKINGALNPAGFEVAAESDNSGWDAVTRLFEANGSPSGSEATLNTTTVGDQFSPKLLALNSRVLAVWTSFGQDGADEGLYGRLVSSGGPEEGEFLVNTRTIGKQLQPAVARSGDTAIVVWASFMGGLESYDLFAQNFKLAADLALSAPAAPFVSPLSANSISVTWSEQVSQDIETYLIYADDEAVGEASVTGLHTITRSGWAAKSTHSFRLAYRTRDGRTSPLSEAVTATTFGADANGDGLPDDWQTENWGKKWPDALADSDGDGATNLAEFLAGTDPTDPSSVLKISISSRQQGLYLQWNTLPGNYYRLQITADFKTWSDVGTPRFAASTAEAVPIALPGQVQYYRVIRMR